MKHVVLASTSPRRKELLAQIDVPFTAIAPPFEEDMTLDLPVVDLAKTLAEGKARSVLDLASGGSVIVGADTFIEFNGELLGKPANAKDAKSMLGALSGSRNIVHTGYAVVDANSGRIASGCVSSVIHMASYSEVDIDRYIATGEPLDKAGAYAINGLGAVLIDRIEGDYSAVVGLPLAPLARALQAFGVGVFPSV